MICSLCSIGYLIYNIKYINSLLKENTLDGYFKYMFFYEVKTFKNLSKFMPKLI